MVTRNAFGYGSESSEAFAPERFPNPHNANAAIKILPDSGA